MRDGCWGAVDIGSNSVRFLVAQVTPAGMKPLWSSLVSTRLGRDMAHSPILSKEAVEATLAAMVEAWRTMQRWLDDPARVAVLATSAVREARNGAAFCRMVAQQLGMTVQVLSGEAEGKLSYEGAVAGLTAEPLQGKQAIVVDIGGGSAEVVCAPAGRWHRWSLPLGAVRLTQTGWQREMIAAAWRPVVNELVQIAETAPMQFVGVGGTVTTLAALEAAMVVYDPERIHGAVVTREAARRWLATLLAMPLTERRSLAGLQPERADIIPAGLAVLVELMDGADAEQLMVSETDLLYAALLRHAQGRFWDGLD